MLIQCNWTFSDSSVAEQAPAIMSSSGPDQPDSQIATSTPDMEKQPPVYPVSFHKQEPEHTPSNIQHQQDQGNLKFHFTQTKIITVKEAYCTNAFVTQMKI